ncbi:hypothetical protein PAXRUDRAFT_168826 [Paxillus rubicundulus Ve08.2h10]|uniref:Uncharacterized protein n=1 Tax=Paxillus rubicundulus Ve08.2h10 TaxID=930991 RepID=A0A0D0DG02_9AGAM|nr:hypothetical protein PAXRUDRAFT_168826 [Paxillus rubicundulus Ve08.2h10]
MDPAAEIKTPDYSTAEFNQECQELRVTGFTEEQAIAVLQRLCHVQEQKERDIRARERQEALLAEAEAGEQAAQLQCQHEDEDVQALQEEHKKHKSKFAPIPDVPVPTEPIIMAAQAVLCKLKNHQFVKMWYWTNDGLDVADCLKANVIDDCSLSLITTAEGLPAFIPSASTHNKLEVTPDEDLTFKQFGQASV